MTGYFPSLLVCARARFFTRFGTPACLGTYVGVKKGEGSGKVGWGGMGSADFFFKTPNLKTFVHAKNPPKIEAGSN